MTLRDFIIGLPKAELHLHIEGSLEPDLMMRLAEKNGINLPYGSIQDIENAYNFENLQDFLDLYYQGMSVLREEDDFRALAAAYMDRIAADGVVHAEIFYDPQGHTERGISLDVCTNGILAGLEEGGRKHGITTRLILCFLRHLSEDQAIETFNAAGPWFDDGRIIGVGLDSTERDNPPEKFQRVFKKARDRGLKVVAHAGEEGPPDYVRQAVDLLQVDRIDHGNASMQDPALVARLADMGIALTVCPLSNVKLCGVPTMADHPLKRMLDAGLAVTVNSDDPSYFGGYVADNYLAVAEALDLSRQDLTLLARNSLQASFLEPSQIAGYVDRLDAYLADTD